MGGPREWSNMGTFTRKNEGASVTDPSTPNKIALQKGESIRSTPPTRCRAMPPEKPREQERDRTLNNTPRVRA